MREAIAMVAVAPEFEGEMALRDAAEAALATRVELRDELDADFATALDELFACIVERDAEPPKD